ncbi:MAG: DUF2905 family protein [Candidatus Delongbacteria bacterium]|nr:DUF2905 family protein [Candidatus Delongbacteria bacterium]
MRFLEFLPSSVKLFAILYFIIMGFIYALQRNRAQPIVIPGDIYIHKNQKYIYIPLGLTFVLTLIFFLVFNNIRKRWGIEF